MLYNSSNSTFDFLGFLALIAQRNRPYLLDTPDTYCGYFDHLCGLFDNNNNNNKKRSGMHGLKFRTIYFPAIAICDYSLNICIAYVLKKMWNATRKKFLWEA